MSSEWLKVMLDEIERKNAQAELDRIEEERRRVEAQKDCGRVELNNPQGK